jgi:hypothetical protein
MRERARYVTSVLAELNSSLFSFSNFRVLRQVVDHPKRCKDCYVFEITFSREDYPPPRFGYCATARPVSNRSYRGARKDSDTVSDNYVHRVLEDGTVTELAPRTDLANHSPTGFNWGCGGVDRVSLPWRLSATCYTRHLQSTGEVPLLLRAMDEIGIERVIILGSSAFTITSDYRFGFTRNDENNREIVSAAGAHADRIEAWPTLDPLDLNKINKLRSYREMGARMPAI